MRITAGVVLAAVCASNAPAQTQSIQPTPSTPLTFARVGGFSAPCTAVAVPPDRPGDVYVLEKAGRLRLIRDGTLQTAPVVNFSTLVADSGEAGALGLALHPAFASNGFVYVFYSGRSGSTFVARYTVALPDRATADPASRTTVLTMTPGASIHNGGWLGFGPDGLLYISRGETGSSTLAQPLNTLNGKILRIDVDGDDFPSDDAANYAIPAGNPYSAPGDGARDEVLHSGLRNPWRCSFDRLTGELWIDDVGANSREEVNRVPAGAAGLNFGWPCREGFETSATFGGCASPPAVFTPPLVDFIRNLMSCSIGGYVYRGCSMPGLSGRYVMAACSGRVLSIDPSNPAAVARDHGVLSTGVYGFGEDAAGELLVCTPSGLYRVRQTIAPTLIDCNDNGRQDACDIASGVSADADGDGVPDECGPCVANFDGSGGVTVGDLFGYLGAFFDEDPRADVDGVAGITVDDIFAFLDAWFEGC